MGVKAALSKVYAGVIQKKIEFWRKDAVKLQEQVLHQLLEKGKHTVFGRDHGFDQIHDYASFKQQVPIRDYEGLKPYVEKILAGQSNVLWPGKPLYLAKTSGTTSGLKYIPLSKSALKHQINAARDALLNYIHETGNTAFVNGKMIFLQGSPTLELKNGIAYGRLSGIVAHHVPKYLQKNRLPSYETNCIDDWETKVEAIVKETKAEDMRLISGIPPWVQMYFDRLSQETGGKPIHEIFPNFSLLVYGGVNFEPYRAKMEASIGKTIDAVETYPASEGFIAFQNSQNEKGLLLLPDSGIFYEFIPADEFHSENPRRLSLGEIELDVNYALILNSDAGLWGYSLGDTVRFISKDPYLLLVTGRIKHFISAFGEHVIGEEVENALLTVARKHGVHIVEFTVAPQVNPDEGELPFHEWFVEFEQQPQDLQAFSQEVDAVLQSKNAYYLDLIQGKILQTLKMRPVKRDTFIAFMRGAGKLGGQNKLPRLSNDRKIADALAPFIG